MRILLLALLLAAGPALAQDEGEPLVFSVTPSSIDDGGAAARARIEALMRRREAADYRFRSICVACGGRDRWGAASVDPMQALGGRRPPAEPASSLDRP
ncbi:MAG TPA: hypothetical protein VEA41_01060 [Salinarimonas sp.]|nr:hypothetical protein [Salinarimonas sp.]